MKGKVLLVRWLFLQGIFFVSILCNSCKSKSKSYEPMYVEDSSQKKTLLYAVPTQAFYEMSVPFVNYLNQHLRDVHIQIVASSNFSDYVNKMKNGLFDLATPNGVMILNNNFQGYTVAGESVGEEPNAGAILVHKDSLVHNFTDLKGRSIATPGSPALPGHMLQMVYLSKKGLDVNSEIKLKYVESFESVILNIYLGKCSAGFAAISGWHDFVKKRPEMASKVALKWVTPAAPGNILLIHKNINEKTVNQLKNLVLTMHMNKDGRKALSNIGYIKFVQADSNTYLPLKKFLKEYNDLVTDPKQ